MPNRQPAQLLAEINREIVITNPQDTKKLHSLRTLKKQLQERIQAAQPVPAEAVFYVSLPMRVRVVEAMGQSALKRLPELDQEVAQITQRLAVLQANSRRSPELSQELAQITRRKTTLLNERQELERQIKTSKFWPSVATATAPGTTSARWVRCPWDERENVAWFLDSIGASWQEVEE